MRMRKILVGIVIFMGLMGCQKEFNIADFQDEFEDYKVELRIEAILDPIDFMNSVVRVDRTILVTDTSLFNGRDDNGDWVSYTDVNNNGLWDEGEPLNDDIGFEDQESFGTIVGRGNGKPDQGEPHVDDYIEILPQIHDSTMALIELIHKASGDIIAKFEWVTKAGEFEVGFGESNPTPGGVESTITRTYTYGGYKPTQQFAEVNIEFGEEYEFHIVTSDGEEITGTTVPLQPAKIYGDGLFWNNDTLVNYPESSGKVKWLTDPRNFVSYVKIEKVFSQDSLRIEYNLLISPIDESEFGQPIYSLPTNLFTSGLFKVTIFVLDEHYSNYFISSLPLRDKSLSNLRDQDGNVVLGIAGSSTARSVYLRNN
jgi:hypothetical protein